MHYSPPIFDRCWTTKVPEMLEELHTFLPARVYKAEDGKQYVLITNGYLEEVEPDVFTRCGASTALAFVLDMVCDAIEDMDENYRRQRYLSYVVGKMSASRYFASIAEYEGPLTDEPEGPAAINHFGGTGSSRAEAALDGLLQVLRT